MTEWHAVKSRPGAEGRALIGIEACGMTGFLPVELFRKDHRGEREVTWRALFPGYLFVRCDLGCDLSRLLEIDGIEDVLRGRHGAAPVADAVIEAIRTAERVGSFDRTRTPRLAHGDDVVIQDGPFAHLVAKIKSERPSKRMARCMELVGNYPFRITASVDNLEKKSA
jgi:transcription antitermination factor NusG